MSHRFKRPKQLGNSKRNTKNGNVESPKELPMAQDSAGIYDFLYVDRARISTIYAQLFPAGVITNVKTSSQQTSSDDTQYGSDVKVFKLEGKSAEGTAEGIEHMFDASWTIPVEVLAALHKKSHVRSSVKNADLGSIILAEKCHLRVIDFASMDGLWEVGMNAYQRAIQERSHEEQSTQPSLMANEVLAVLKAMPKAIHAHILTDEVFLWSSLQPSGLAIPASDLTLKYGGEVVGVWQVLYVLDAFPDSGNAPDISIWSGGDTANSMLTMMHGVRTLVGRPPTWCGATPLMIFRLMGGSSVPALNE